jgi:hypothetical protein
VLAGSGPITDQQALDWSKQVLIADGRFTADLELMSSDPNPELSKDAIDVSHGYDPTYVTVNWFDKKTYHYWFVQFKRLNGKVEGVSSRGE